MTGTDADGVVHFVVTFGHMLLSLCEDGGFCNPDKTQTPTCLWCALETPMEES